MDVDELLARRRNIEQRVGLRRHFRHSAADEQHEIGRIDAALQLRIGSDADFAAIVGMVAVEQRRAAKRDRDRQVEALGEALERRAAAIAPADAAEDRDRPFGDRTASFAVPPFALAPARSAPASTRGASRTSARSVSTSSGRAITTGPGRPCIAHMIGALDDFRDARGILDLRRPFGRRAEKGADSPSPGTRRARACRARPGRRTGSAEPNRAARYARHGPRWSRRARGSRSRCPGDRPAWRWRSPSSRPPPPAGRP